MLRAIARRSSLTSLRSSSCRLFLERLTSSIDTDTGIVEILKRNLEILKKYPRVKETWCVMQVHNLEDEIKRSTDVKEIKDLLGSKSNKEYKHDFIIEKNLYDKLKRHLFDFERIWVTSPDNAFSVIKNCGEKIKKRGY